MANRAPVSGTALFLSFLIIGCTSFGGGLTAWIRRELVERRGWIDDQQFLANYGLSQMVPGATNVNLAVLIGAQLRGASGALIALAGLLLVPLAILLALGGFYFAAHGASHATLLNTALAGAGAVAIGFNVATGIRLGLANIRRLGPALIAAAIVVGIGIFRIPLLEVLLVAHPGQPRAHFAAAQPMIATLLQIAAMFAVLSLLAFGGGAAVLPDMQHQAVDVHHWVTAREFLDMFALSRAVPPGSLIVVAGGPEGGGRGRRPGGDAGDVRSVLPGGVRGRAALASCRRRGVAGNAGAGVGAGIGRPDHCQRHRPGPQHRA